MKLDKFSGAMRPSIAPTLLSPRDAVYSSNIEIDDYKGTLRSRRKNNTPWGDFTAKPYGCVHEGRVFGSWSDVSWMRSRGKLFASEDPTHADYSVYDTHSGWNAVMQYAPSDVTPIIIGCPTPTTNGTPKNYLPPNTAGADVVCDSEAITLDITTRPESDNDIERGTYRFSVMLETTVQDANGNDIKTSAIVAEETLVVDDKMVDAIIYITLNVNSTQWMYDDQGNAYSTELYVLRGTEERGYIGFVAGGGHIFGYDMYKCASYQFPYVYQSGGDKLEYMKYGAIEPGLYRYAITVAKATDAGLWFESRPLYTDWLRVHENGVVLLTDIEAGLGITPDNGYSIRAYRIGGTSTEWQFCDVGWYDSNDEVWHFVDTQHSSMLKPETLITVDDTEPFPVKMLCDYNDMVFAVPLDRPSVVRFSAIGRPESFNKFAYFNFSAEITAMISTDNGILIFTKTSTTVIIGTGKDDMFRTEIDNRVGCTGMHAVDHYKGTAVWFSNDGICMRAGNKVRNLTSATVPNLVVPHIEWAGSHCDATDYNVEYTYYCLTPQIPIEFLKVVGDNVYMADVGNGFVSVYDMLKRTLAFVEDIDDGDVCTSFYDTDTSELALYYEYAEQLQTLTTPRHMDSAIPLGEAYFMSAPITNGSITTLKRYDNFRVTYVGTLIVYVFIDGDMVASPFMPTNSEVKTVEFRIPADTLTGYYIQFGLIIKGEVTELEFDVLPRQGDN